VNDQQTWLQAVTATLGWYDRLDVTVREQLDDLIEQIRRAKQELMQLVLVADGSAVCRSCGGECCRYGKYHVTSLDLLALRQRGEGMIVPDFLTHPACPYADTLGCCTMAVEFRPLTCVIFNCEQLENRLSSLDQAKIRTLEQLLRSLISRAEQVSGIRLNRPALLSAETKP